ncbi:ABC transporter substrate-binding protein [Amycolatopsis pithecellobii]|nr:ABC transporter substrate-binding protein [Amycolatopsis pithecellobii]
MEQQNARTDVKRRSKRGALNRFAPIVVFGLAGVLLAACGSAGGSRAAGESVSQLRVGVMNPGPAYALLYWAKAKGYFQNAGLDLTISADGAGMPANFVAGKSDTIYTSQGSSFAAINQGKPVVSIYGTEAGGSGYVVTSDPAVKSPLDCKTVSTGTAGQAIYAWTKQLEKVYKTKWELTQLSGDVSALTANVVGGRTKCAVGSIAYFQAGIQKGQLRVVFDPVDKAKLPADWPILGIEGVFAALPGTLNEKRPAFEKLLKGYNNALTDYLAAQPKDIAQTLIAFDKGFSAIGSVDALALTIEQARPNLSPNRGYIPQNVWPSTLSFYESGGLDFLAKDPGRFDYGKVVDMSVYDAAIGRP